MGEGGRGLGRGRGGKEREKGGGGKVFIHPPPPDRPHLMRQLVILISANDPKQQFVKLCLLCLSWVMTVKLNGLLKLHLEFC